VVDELQYLGLWGALPDWRQIQRIPEAGLRAEIVKLHGIPAGDRRALCNQLEQLNRTLNLGLPERIAQGTFGTLPWEGLPTMTPEAMFQAETARMARMVTRANGQAEPTEPSPTLETPTLTGTPGLASPSPAGGFTQPVPGSHSQGAPFVEPASGEAPCLEASLQAGAAFFVESSQLAPEGAPYPFISSNPQVRINPEAALAKKFARLRRLSSWLLCTHAPFCAFLWRCAFEGFIGAEPSIRVPTQGASAQPSSCSHCSTTTSVSTSAQFVRFYETDT